MKPNSVDAYITAFPKEVQRALSAVRQTIRDNAPEANEGIAYGMPAYKTGGRPLQTG